MNVKPYINWTRDELYTHFLKQSLAKGYDLSEIRTAVYSDGWDPMTEYNGCTMVQDPIHPFWPCFKHDYNWIVGGGGIEADREFYEDLKAAGFLNIEARIWFLGVRIGWVLWYKWKQ